MEVSYINEADVPAVTRSRSSKFDGVIDALNKMAKGKALFLKGGTQRNAATIVALARRRGINASYVRSNDGICLVVREKEAPTAPSPTTASSAPSQKRKK